MKLFKKFAVTSILIACLSTVIMTDTTVFAKSTQPPDPPPTPDNVVIYLDPGHGGSDPGALTQFSDNDEAYFNLAVAEAAQTYLMSNYSGVTVNLTRTEDTYLSLTDRVALAAANNADILVSIHNNAYDGKARGTEVWVSSNKSYKASSSALGALILGEIKTMADEITPENGAVVFTNRGVKYSNTYTIINNSVKAGFPGIIIEHLFMDNADDYHYFLSSPEKLERLGKADALAIASYYHLQPNQ
ncbi:MAG: N-acetylmuramoyl-L-alanine amidase [Acetobacterium woodii]|nr:N-acetylmuramoyl-L-alanine amidase [Acetobacterium woodii]